jgi:hypothetical protein
LKRPLAAPESPCVPTPPAAKRAVPLDRRATAPAALARDLVPSE